VVDFWPHLFARKSSFIVCSSPTRNPFAIKNPKLRTDFVKIASIVAPSWPRRRGSFIPASLRESLAADRRGGLDWRGALDDHRLRDAATLDGQLHPLSNSCKPDLVFAAAPRCRSGFRPPPSRPSDA